MDLKIDKLDLKQINMQVWNKKFKYRMRHWIALNSENYLKYRALEKVEDKLLMLEQILKGNILSMAKGIEWNIDKQIELKIEKVEKELTVKLKGVKVSAFDLVFETNVFLPDNIGLGKSVTFGYGVVRPYREKVIHTEDVERA
ncbi:MAG: CRISPR-associated endonuclease Cas6 [Bacteroidetes bacterium]|nr:CRISPR-associated endonuclease Cas6 [Bacteroidota bacterium]